MKKILLLLFMMAIETTASCFGQNNVMNIHLKNGTIAQYNVSDIEEVDWSTTTDNPYIAVDLGLSVKWANMNIGATTPENYGIYFAWGEIEPKEEYNWATYKHCNGTGNTITKYCTNITNGTVDRKSSLDRMDDVAYNKWGGSWRMPTRSEVEELLNKCTWTMTESNGVKGYKVTGNNGNSIFLPLAGIYNNDKLHYDGELGGYWSNSLKGDQGGYGLNLEDKGNWGDDFWRYLGLPVRPVRP